MHMLLVSALGALALGLGLLVTLPVGWCAITGAYATMVGFHPEPDPVRGEIVLVLEPAGRHFATAAAHEGTGWAAAATPGSADAVRTALRDLLDAGIGTKRAAGIVAGLAGLPKRQVYDLALALLGGGER